MTHGATVLPSTAPDSCEGLLEISGNFEPGWEDGKGVAQEIVAWLNELQGNVHRAFGSDLTAPKLRDAWSYPWRAIQDLREGVIEYPRAVLAYDTSWESRQSATFEKELPVLAERLGAGVNGARATIVRGRESIRQELKNLEKNLSREPLSDGPRGSYRRYGGKSRVAFWGMMALGAAAAGWSAYQGELPGEAPWLGMGFATVTGSELFSWLLSDKTSSHYLSIFRARGSDFIERGRGYGDYVFVRFPYRADDGEERVAQWLLLGSPDPEKARLLVVTEPIQKTE